MTVQDEVRRELLNQMHLRMDGDATVLRNLAVAYGILTDKAYIDATGEKARST